MESSNKLRMCRLCLCVNDCFINIFEVNDWQGYVAANVISDLLQFQVYETDGYPHIVCSKCLAKLTEFKIFKECCQKSKVAYDNISVSSEILKEHKPEMDIGEGGSGLDLCGQDPLREASSDPIIKQEEFDIDSSGDGSEEAFAGTNTEVSFGPILLKNEMFSFNMDSHTQYHCTADKTQKNVELLDYDVELGINTLEQHQSAKSSRKMAAKGNQHKRSSAKEGINVQREIAYVIKKRRQISTETKLKMLHAVDLGEKKKEVAKRFGVPNSTLSSILAYRDKIENAAQLGPNRKRARACINDDLDKRLFEWFVRAKASNIPLSGPILQQQARDEALKLGMDNFQASNGWLQKFKIRWNLTTLKTS